jgi:hypothetical protein
MMQADEEAAMQSDDKDAPMEVVLAPMEVVLAPMEVVLAPPRTRFSTGSVCSGLDAEVAMFFHVG